MVKAIIKDYMPPHTSCMQVELEDELCSSADVQNPNTNQGRIEKQDINTDFSYNYPHDEWDSQTQ